MSKNKNAAEALQRHDGREKNLKPILRHLADFVQWLTGAVGCCLTWTQAVLWCIRAPGFDIGLFLCGGLLVAAAAVMEIKEG